MRVIVISWYIPNNIFINHIYEKCGNHIPFWNAFAHQKKERREDQDSK